MILHKGARGTLKQFAPIRDFPLNFDQQTIEN